MAESLLCVQLTPGADERVHILTIASPIGQPEGRVTPPFTAPAERQAIAQALEAVRFELPAWQQTPAAFQALKALGLGDEGGFNRLREQVGEMLFEAFFPPGGLREALRAALDPAQTGATTRIELRFNANAVALGAYPWELLRDPERGFLFANRSAALARYITCTRPAPRLLSLAADEALRLLLVVSRPIDHTLPLLLDAERQAIEEGLAEPQADGRLRLDELSPASAARSTWELLSDYLAAHEQDNPPHVFHFDGHGGYGRRCGRPPVGCGALNEAESIVCRECGQRLDGPAQGYLAFEERNKRPHWVSAAELSNALTGVGVRLAVLTACRSATVGGQSIFSGIAPALIQAGVPAVVAMQYSVTADAAREFARIFYRALAAAEPLTKAVGRARAALFADPTAWYRPVLYLRTDARNPEGRIFKRQRQQRQLRQSEPSSTGVSPAQPPAGSDIPALLRRILSNLADTEKAFAVQRRRRNQLVMQLRARLALTEQLSFERFFFRYYDQLAAEERFEFQQIRGMTQGTLQERNRDTLQILDAHPELLAAVPGLAQLRAHLVVWLNKYDQTFVHTPQMCLLYVGVEDGVPFPTGIEKQIAAWLAAQAPVPASPAPQPGVTMTPGQPCPAPTLDRRALRAVLVENFDIEGLKELCAEVQDDLAAGGIVLQVNLDMVGGESKVGKVLNLIQYLDHRGYLGCLEAAARRLRPGKL